MIIYWAYYQKLRPSKSNQDRLISNLSTDNIEVTAPCANKLSGADPGVGKRRGTNRQSVGGWEE